MEHNGEGRRKRDILKQDEGLHVDISHGVDLLWGNDSLKHSYLMHLADKGLGMQTCKKTKKATGRNNTICKLSRPKAWRGKRECSGSTHSGSCLTCFVLPCSLSAFTSFWLEVFFPPYLSFCSSILCSPDGPQPTLITRRTRRPPIVGTMRGCPL